MERWKKIVGLPSYKVSSTGDVLHSNNGIVRRLEKFNSDTVFIEGIARSIPVLVATAFLLREDHQIIVKHLDGDKTNNRVENLKWI